MTDLTPLFSRLARSPFRSRFRLGAKERQYCWDKGAGTIDQHAADFIARRLAPALPDNDGKQTPMRGHPVFIAQHATATCCRGCLAKWHHIPSGVALSDSQQLYIVQVIHFWLDAPGSYSSSLLPEMTAEANPFRSPAEPLWAV